MQPLKKALIIGDLLWQESTEGTLLGGWATSFALQLKRLGVHATLASGVGNDENGSKAIRELDSLGLDTSLIGVERRMKTNTCQIEFVATDEPHYHNFSIGAADAVATSSVLLAEAASAELLYCNSFSFRTIISKTCTTIVREHATHALKVFDLRFADNFIPDETVSAGLSGTDILRVSRHDLERVTQALDLPPLDPLEFCKVMLNRYGVKTCLVSDPVYGLVAASQDEEAIIGPPPPEQIPSNAVRWHETFLAAFIVEKCENSPLEKCCEYGQRYANTQS